MAEFWPMKCEGRFTVGLLRKNTFFLTGDKIHIILNLPFFWWTAVGKMEKSSQKL